MRTVPDRQPSAKKSFLSIGSSLRSECVADRAVLCADSQVRDLMRRKPTHSSVQRVRRVQWISLSPGFGPKAHQPCLHAKQEQPRRPTVAETSRFKPAPLRLFKSRRCYSFGHGGSRLKCFSGSSHRKRIPSISAHTILQMEHSKWGKISSCRPCVY